MPESSEAQEPHSHMPIRVVRSDWPTLAGLRDIVVFGDSYSDTMFLTDNWASDSEHARLASSEPHSQEPHSHMPIHVVRSDWPTLARLRDIVVFGDSYSDTTFLTDNWVHHLLSRLESKHNNASVRIHNYAVAGDTAEDDLQVQLRGFLKRIAEPDAPTLEPSETLYVFWLGINDCGGLWVDDYKGIIGIIFSVMDKVCTKAKARNFLVIDVPPIDRSPAASNASGVLAQRYLAWNELLRFAATTYATVNPLATVFVFSSYAVLSKVLDRPTEHGFDTDDAAKMGGGIWEDMLHLTSAVHGILADELVQALE